MITSTYLYGKHCVDKLFKLKIVVPNEENRSVLVFNFLKSKKVKKYYRSVEDT